MDIKKSILFVIDNEGREYVSHENDKGGPTKFGISLKFLRLYRNDPKLEAKDIINLSESEAADIYDSAWLSAYKYEQISDAKLMTKIFDISVNAGPFNAAKIVQRAVNNLSDNSLRVDGVLGSKSFNVINALISEGEKSKLYNLLILEIMQYYIDIVVRDNSQIVFLKGWINRARREPADG